MKALATTSAYSDFTLLASLVPWSELATGEMEMLMGSPEAGARGGEGGGIAGHI